MHKQTEHPIMPQSISSQRRTEQQQHNQIAQRHQRRSPIASASTLFSSIALLLLTSLQIQQQHQHSVKQVTAHFVDPSVNAFGILIADTAEHTATLPHPQSAADPSKPPIKCTFAFTTGTELQAPIETSDTATPSHITLADQLQRFASVCVESKFNYWAYELCFGRQLRQFHDSDNYVLARASQAEPGVIDEEKHTLTLRAGDACQIAGKDSVRSATVTFVCLQNAVRQPRITSVEEPSTCAYTVQVASAIFCADPRYAVILDSGAGSVEQTLTSEDRDAEDWLLELTQVVRSGAGDAQIGDAKSNSSPPPQLQYMCQAFTLESRAAQGSKLNFQRFELKITGAEDRAVTVQHSASDYTARHSGRVAIPAVELYAERARLANSPRFDGKLAFVKIYA